MKTFGERKFVNVAVGEGKGSKSTDVMYYNLSESAGSKMNDRLGQGSLTEGEGTVQLTSLY